MQEIDQTLSPTLSDPSQTPPSPGVEEGETPIGEGTPQSDTFGNSSENYPQENTSYKYDEPVILAKTIAYIERTRIPLIEELTDELDVTDNTIVSWEKKYPPFSRLIEKLKRKQKAGLVRDGMSRDKGQTMPIFLLKVNHNMVERQIIETPGAGEGLSLLREIIKKGEHGTREPISDTERETETEPETA